MSGVRVELAIEEPTGCPLAGYATDGAATVRDRLRTDDAVVEEVAADAELTGRAIETVDDDAAVYRMERPNGENCICDELRAAGHPVGDATVEDGDLYLTLYLSEAADFEGLVDRLREYGGAVSLRSLTRNGQAGSGSDPAVVDRDRLTDRQREVLETALEMGYYEYPRAANATEVGERLGLTASTVVEHLTLAEAKLFDDVFDG